MNGSESVQRSALSAQRSASGVLSVLGWALFLACSWTWCIGMFLPVILLRDYGAFGWVVFALPNIIGAAAMGWVLQRGGQSQAMVRDHGPAMVAFSVVTIGFHVLFVSWVVRWLGTIGPLAEGIGGWDGGWVLMAAAVGIAAVCLPILTSNNAAVIASALLWVGSLIAFIVTVLHTPRLPVATGQPSLDLAYLAPVCIIGFGLCPYADLTFHRARQALSSYGAIAGFTLGFGAFFLVMIMFTLWYGPLVVPPDIRRAGSTIETVTTVAAAAVAWHMVAQSGFTVAAHGLEVVRRLRQDRRSSIRWGGVVGLLYVLGILVPMWVLMQRGFSYGSLALHEIGYRLFLAFYGLVTPAYMLLIVCPWPGQRATATARWVGLVVTLALAGPAFWMGFIEQRTIWLTAGAAVLLLARPVVEWLARLTPSTEMELGMRAEG